MNWWGRIKPGAEGPPAPDSPEVIKAAKAKLVARLDELPVEKRETSELLIDYLEKKQRSESREMAGNNWHVIQAWGRAISLMLVAFIIAAAVFGVATYKNTHNVARLTKANRENLTALGRLVAKVQEIKSDNALAACEEGNRQHREAIPLVIGLISSSAGSSGDPAVEAAEREAAAVLAAEAAGDTNPPLPKTVGGREALTQIRRFVQIIAPFYDCKERVELATDGPGQTPPPILPPPHTGATAP